jgi:carbamoyltransferase
MNILGINFGHDASIVFIQNGVVQFAIEEEKISRIKQDFGWPRQALERLFFEHNLAPKDIDHIAFGGLVYNTLGKEEIKYRFSKSSTHKNKEIIDRILAYYRITSVQISEKNKKVMEDCVKQEGFSKSSVHFFNHHLCHAASAFYAAPFEADLVITADGLGDGESFNFYTKVEGSITPLVINGFENSVGQFYSAITKLLGFRPNRHEGKITGLAAFGKPTDLVDKFGSLFWYEQDQLKRYPHGTKQQEMETYKPFEKLSLKDKINKKTSEDAISLEYAENALLLEHKLEEFTKGHTKEDIAYACQIVSENVIVKETRRVIHKHLDKNEKIKLACAGGIFANVRINQKLLEMNEVENIFIQPAMGDAGLALGAAILCDIELTTMKTSVAYQFFNTYYGPSYSMNEVKNFLDVIKTEATVIKMKEPAKEIAQMLKDNLVVGFWHGKMEWGPRALGSRSMILNTFDRKVNDSVNKRLSRTEFMPFAPSIIDHMIKTYIPSYDFNCPAGKYMTITYDVAPQFHNELQAVVHVDGTARPQLVDKVSNPYYYEIIDAFYKLTGCGAIVNTSFNAHEEPIVSSPAAAFGALKDDRIDVLVLDDYRLQLIRK